MSEAAEAHGPPPRTEADAIRALICRVQPARTRENVQPHSTARQSNVAARPEFSGIVAEARTARAENSLAGEGVMRHSSAAQARREAAPRAQRRRMPARARMAASSVCAQRPSARRPAPPLMGRYSGSREQAGSEERASACECPRPPRSRVNTKNQRRRNVPRRTSSRRQTQPRVVRPAR